MNVPPAEPMSRSASTRGAVLAYGLSLAALTLAVILRWLLDPLMGDTLPLVTLFGAVAIAVWMGGYRPAILVVVLGYLAAAYLFIQPRGRIGLEHFEQPGRAGGVPLHLLAHHRLRLRDAAGPAPGQPRGTRCCRSRCAASATR